MYGVFSKFLLWAWPPSSLNDDSKLHGVIDRMREYVEKHPDEGKWAILYQPQIFTQSILTCDEGFNEKKFVYQCYTNDGLRSVIVWINKNILLQMTKDTCITTEVKLRIATSMINKLVDQEKLSKDYGILAHDLLIANVRELQSELVDEDLPF